MSDDERKLEDLMPSNGDALILVRNGQAAGAYMRRGDEIYRLPVEVTTDYDTDAADPLTPRRFTIRAGRNAKDHKRWMAAR